MDTKDGRITIQLRPDLAPNHAAQLESTDQGTTSTMESSFIG